jgi:hypothetical protein
LENVLVTVKDWPFKVNEAKGLMVKLAIAGIGVQAPGPVMIPEGHKFG